MDAALTRTVRKIGEHVHASRNALHRDTDAVAAREAAVCVTSHSATNAARKVDHIKALALDIIAAVPRILDSRTDDIPIPLLRFAAASLLDQLSDAITHSVDAVHSMHAAVVAADAASSDLYRARDTANESIKLFNAQAEEWAKCKATWAECQRQAPPAAFTPTPLLDTHHQPLHTTAMFDSDLSMAGAWAADKRRVLGGLTEQYQPTPSPRIPDQSGKDNVTSGNDMIATYNRHRDHANQTKERNVAAAHANTHAPRDAHTAGLLQLQAEKSDGAAAVDALRLARQRLAHAVATQTEFHARIDAIIANPTGAIAHPVPDVPPVPAAHYADRARATFATSAAAQLQFTSSLANRVRAITHIAPDAQGATVAIESIKLDAARALDSRRVDTRAQIAKAVMELRQGTTASPASAAPAVLGVAVGVAVATTFDNHTSFSSSSSASSSPPCIVATCPGSCKPHHMQHMHFVCSTCEASFTAQC
jgi:hypothetical protein